MEDRRRNNVWTEQKIQKVEKRQSYGQKTKKSAKLFLNGRVKGIMQKKCKKLKNNKDTAQKTKKIRKNILKQQSQKQCCGSGQFFSGSGSGSYLDMFLMLAK